MQYVIENEYFAVKSQTKGAELTSFFNKKENYEYIWQAGEIWAKHSPVLFPVVGDLKDNKIQIDNQIYAMTKHGFARDSEFHVIENKTDSLTYELLSGECTKQIYPYDFRFCIKYTLDKNKLIIEFALKNTSARAMYFSLGAHPAFNCNIKEKEKFSDYYLEFEKKENASVFLKESLVDIKPVPLFHNTKIFNLTAETFNNKAFIFKDLQSESVILKNKNNKRAVKLSFNSPYFMIWTKKENFICLEPAWGIDDNINSSGIIEEKEGINKLEAGREFLAFYQITAW